MELSTALLTIIGSGVVAAAVAYLLNSNKEQIFFMRKKAEDLYIATEEFDKMFNSATFMAYPLFRGQIDYNTYLDQIIEKGQKLEKSETQYGLNVKILTRIYFPNLIPLLEEWEKSQANINQVISDHKIAYKNGEADPVIYLPLLQKVVLIQIDGSKAFKSALIKDAQKLASPAALWPESLRIIGDRAISVMPKIKSGAGDLYRRLRKDTKGS